MKSNPRTGAALMALAACMLIAQNSHAEDALSAPLPSVMAEAPAQPFTLTDERPENERKLFGGSSFIFSCNFGVFGLGDRQVPGRMELLNEQIANDFGDRVAGKRIEILHYSIYINAHWRLRGDAVSAGMGSVGVFASANRDAKGSPCPREKMKGGWYSGSEISTSFSPVVIEIEAQMDGQIYKGRAVYSHSRELPLSSSFVSKKAFKSAEEVEAFRQAMTEANTNLISNLASGLSPPS